MNNRIFLILIVVLLTGILGMLVMGSTRHDDSVSGSVGEVVEEIGDEIDDHTTSN